MHRKISLTSLVLLIIASIDSIRNLPASALFGSSLIFFFLLAALLFLIPTALVAAELASAFPERGGIFEWARAAFGEKVGMLAVWLQWINTVFWYPTILTFLGGTLAYVISPAIANSELYQFIMIVVIFWSLTWINLKGVHFSARVNHFCATIGVIFPLVLLIFLGAIWLFKGKPLQIEFTWNNILPSFNGAENWVSLVAVMSSFLGMELAGVHVNDVSQPQKNFPRAVALSSTFILITMLFGSLAIAIVLPKEEINLVAGVMQVFGNFFAEFGIAWMLPLIMGLIIAGSFGGIINWLISPVKGMLHAAEKGFLPPFFSKMNAAGAPSRLLITQAIVVSLLGLVFLAVPSVNAFYWFLTTLSTGLYLMMYIMMFAAAIKLRHKFQKQPHLTFRVPGKLKGLWAVCIMGVMGCLITLVVGFFPPDQIHIESNLRYALMIAIGILVAVCPVGLCYYYKKLHKSR